ncbi:MAG: hypothetical protein WDN09_02035 [bacterium]
MIILHQLNPPETIGFFERYPDLNTIWEVAQLQEQARSSYESYGIDPGNMDGEIFSIDKNGAPIGIIGWFVYDEAGDDTLRLRYYGIIVPERRNLHGAEAMNLLLARLSSVAPLQYAYLAESVTLNRPMADAVTKHFRRMGFAEFNDPDYGENAGCGPTRSLRIRIPNR